MEMFNFHKTLSFHKMSIPGNNKVKFWYFMQSFFHKKDRKHHEVLAGSRGVFEPSRTPTVELFCKNS